jgi:succinate dehydrogenase/fumarate reductase flavoprotein subunit
MEAMRSETEVVVVGGGGAGLAAASEAARLGRRVVLLEKNPRLGGSTVWSVGSVTAINTPHQRRAGIRDTPDEHFEDLARHAGPLAPRDNMALRRLLVDNTTDMMAWLMELGVAFIGPMPEPPHRYPRMHNVLPNAGAFVYWLARRCRALGVRIETGTAVERLLVEDGRVVGVAARDGAGQSRHVYASGGVVLASGDYSAGRELKERYADPSVVEVEAVNATATGDGHRIALEVGASVVNGDIVRGPIMRFIPPRRRKLIQVLPPWRILTRIMRWNVEHLPDWLLRPFMMSFLTTALGPSPDLFAQGALLVNGAGERFTDERGRPAYDVTAQPGGVAYIVFDGALARKFQRWPHFVSTAPGIAYAYLDDYRRSRKDIFHQGRTAAALARKLGAPPEALAHTLAEHNARAAREGRPPLGEGPYVALGPVKSYVVFTDGGLKVTEKLEVLGRDDRPIPGLFAAGSTGQGGLLLEGHGHHLGWAFISGRLAGRAAAYRVPPPSAAAAG